MSEEINGQLAIPGSMPEAIYQDLPEKDRAAKLRETADQVVNHTYTRLYTEDQLSEIRENISELCIKISDYERELAAVKARYKALITPLENDREALVSDLRSGGVLTTEECYVYLYFNIGKAGLYTEGGGITQGDGYHAGNEPVHHLLRPSWGRAGRAKSGRFGGKRWTAAA